MTSSASPETASTASGSTGRQMSSQMFTPNVRGPALADEGSRARAEVAHLVEDRVVGQVALLVDARDLAVVRDRRRCVDVLRRAARSRRSR